MRGRIAIPLAAATVSVVSVFLLLERRDSLREASPERATYVGRAECVRCHAEQDRLWRGSHHDLAMQGANQGTVLGDFNTSFRQSEATFTFYTKGGKFYVRTEGPQGEPDDFEIAYTLGATPLQQYLIPFPGGRLQALTVAWDARPEDVGGQRWFHLYPDHAGADDPLHWTRPSQTWNNHCGECHSTNFSKGFDLESRSYKSSWSEIDVSCEACHGPGSAHVRIARSLSSEDPSPAQRDWGFSNPLFDSGESWTFSPDAVTVTPRENRVTDRELETCAHCHSRRVMIAEGHLPGQPLLDSDQVSLLREDLYYADGQILDEVYVYGSFVQSKMYRAGVSCSDCHEPHSLELKEQGNALCTRCHLATHYDARSHHFHEPGFSGSFCVECHMPATTYMQVDPRRDHSLKVPRPDLSATVGTPNSCNRCHVDRSVKWATAVAASWYGTPYDQHFAEAIQAGRMGVPTAVSLLKGIAGDPEQAPIVRGSVLSLLSGFPGMRTESAVRMGLEARNPLVRLGALQALEGAPHPTVLRLAYPVIQDPVRSIRIEAGRLLAPIPKSLLTLEQSVSIDRVVKEYQKAQEVNADHPGAWVNLGNLFAVRGDLPAAERAYETALELDPDYLPAHLNLADFFRATRRDDRAEGVLRRAIERLPNAPELEHALGLLLVRRGQTAQALTRLESAARTAPANARFVYVYAVALRSTGESTLAIQVLKAALERNPYDADLLTALATFNRDIGDVGSAIFYAERLFEVRPEDTGVRQLLQQLKSR